MRTFKSHMLTPSPLRRKSLARADSDTSFEGELGLETPIDADDIFSQSPYRHNAPLKSFDAHLRSVAGPSALGPNSVPFDHRGRLMDGAAADGNDNDDDNNNNDNNDDHVFLSTLATSAHAIKSTQRRPALRTRRSERPAAPPTLAAAAAAAAAGARLRTPKKHNQTRPHSTVEVSKRPQPTVASRRPLSNYQVRSNTRTPPPSIPSVPPLPALPLFQSTPARPEILRVATTGLKRKSADLSAASARTECVLTPLSVTKSSSGGGFDRLAPLPAPKFRVAHSHEETEGFLGRPGTMESLSLGEATQGGVVNERKIWNEEEEAVDVSPGGHVVKRRAKSRPVSWDLQQTCGTTVVRTTLLLSYLGQLLNTVRQLPYNRDESVDPLSPRAFPSSCDDTPSRSLSRTSSIASMSSPKHRKRLSYGSNVPSASVRGRKKTPSQLNPRHQASAQIARPMARIESSGSATMFFGPAIPHTSTPARPSMRNSLVLDTPPKSVPPKPLFSRLSTVARPGYSGGAPLRGYATSPAPSSSPVSRYAGADDDRMSIISDDDMDEQYRADLSMIANIDDEELAGMNEEDIFFASSSFNRSARGDERAATDADESFSWGSLPVHQPMATADVKQNMPSPRHKTARMLEKKYKPRDSGISLTDEEGDVDSRRLNAGRGFGRSGSVSILPPPAMVASTSANTATSSEDFEIISPPNMVSSGSATAWPTVVSSMSESTDGYQSLLSNVHVESEVDAFILRTLLHAQSPDATASCAAPAQKRPPGTPHKRARVSAVARQWHSAFANKVGFDYGGDDGDQSAGAKKKPRKSLPAAFPMLTQGRRKARKEELSDEGEETSPGARQGSKVRYGGLGLGRPTTATAATSSKSNNSWLLRRNSSGAFSAGSGGSGDGSGPATPTEGTGAGRLDHFLSQSLFSDLFLFLCSVAASATPDSIQHCVACTCPSRRRPVSCSDRIGIVDEHGDSVPTWHAILQDDGVGRAVRVEETSGTGVAACDGQCVRLSQSSGRRGGCCGRCDRGGGGDGAGGAVRARVCRDWGSRQRRVWQSDEGAPEGGRAGGTGCRVGGEKVEAVRGRASSVRLTLFWNIIII